MKIIILLLLILSGDVMSTESDGFSHHKLLKTDTDASAYVFDLDQSIYENIHYADLSDIRVANATGDYVPMRLVRASETVTYQYKQTSLPTFKIDRIIKTPVKSQQVRVTRSGQSENHTVTTSQTLLNYLHTEEQQQSHVFYIDASSIIEENVRSFKLDWQFKAHGNRVFFATLEASNDLLNWAMLNPKQKLVDLHIANKHVLENTIPLPPQSYDYYRLSFDESLYPDINNVHAQLLNHEIITPDRQLTLSDFTQEKPDAITWSNSGFYTVENIDIDFNQNNMITDVKIYSKRQNTDKWQFIKKDSLYSIIYEGNEISDTTIKIHPLNHKYWKMVFDDNVNTDAIESINLGWRNHQIQFMAQGQGPFVLLYGQPSMTRHASTKWYANLPQDLRSHMFSKDIQLITDDQSPLVRNKQKNQTKKPILQSAFWIILAVILICLIFMAKRLLNEVKEH